MYSILFDLVSGSSNEGKIVITLPGAAGTERAYISIIGPGGEAVKDVDFGTPDLNINAGTTEFTIDIVDDSNGDPQKGDYEILIYQDHITSPGDYSQFEYEFYFCPVESQVNLAFSANCICGMITVSDLTDYGSAAVTRTMTIVPPTIPGEAAPSSIVTSDSVHEFSFSWANVKYQVVLDVSVSTTIQSGVTIDQEFTASRYFDVICTYNLCSLIECIDSAFSDLISEASAKGGIINLSKSKIDEYLKLVKDVAMHNALIDCGDFDGAQALYDQILEDLDCDCGCSSAPSSEPVQITPQCSGGDGLSFNPTYPVVITGSSGSYSVSLDSAWVAKLNALSVIALESSEDDLEITSSYSALTNTTTFDVNFKRDDWKYIEVGDLLDSFNDYSLNEVAYRKTVGLEVQVYGTIKVAVAATFATDGTEYSLCELPAGYRPTDQDSIAFPVVSKTEGTVMGYCYLKTDGFVVMRPYADWSTNADVLEFMILAPIGMNLEHADGGTLIG